MRRYKGGRAYITILREYNCMGMAQIVTAMAFWILPSFGRLKIL